MDKANKLLRRKMLEAAEGWRKTANQMDKAGYAALDVYTAAQRVVQAIESGTTSDVDAALIELNRAEEKALKACIAILDKAAATIPEDERR